MSLFTSTKGWGVLWIGGSADRGVGRKDLLSVMSWSLNSWPFLCLIIHQSHQSQFQTPPEHWSSPNLCMPAKCGSGVSCSLGTPDRRIPLISYHRASDVSEEIA